MKRQTTTGGKIFTNHVCDQGLESRTQKEPSKLNNNLFKLVFKKWARQTLSQKKIYGWHIRICKDMQHN